MGASLSEKFRDPIDPEGLLVQLSWNNWNNYRTYQGVWAFEMLFHSVHVGGSDPWYYTAAAQPRAYYSTPVVASAGKNEFLGIASPPIPPRSAISTSICRTACPAAWSSTISTWHTS